MTEKRDSWSFSKLSLLVKCGEAYRRQEIEKEYPPSTSTQVRGKALHAVAAEAHMRQMRARQDDPIAPKTKVLRESLPSEEEAGDLAATRFEAERSADGIVAPSDEEKPDRAIGADKDRAVRMSRFYVRTVAPYVDPIAVERKVVVEPTDSNIRLAGIIDLVAQEQDGETVLDLKSKTRKPNGNEAHDSDQLSMYALLRKLETGRIPEKVALNHVVYDARGTYAVRQDSTRTDADLQVMVRRLDNAIETVKAGVYLASGVGSWMCSPKWCRFHSTCNFVRRS